MKRARNLVLAGAVLSALALSPVASALPPAPKVVICHITGTGIGHFIRVSANSLNAHFNHGDCVAAVAIFLGGNQCVC